MNFEDFNWLFEAIIATLIIPLLCIPIKAKWSNLFENKHLPALGKNEYRNFLITNSKPIGDLFHKIKGYKQGTLMKYFCFIEGVPIGALFSMVSFISCFLLSEIGGFNKFPLFTPYYRYLNFGQKDIDLLLILMSFNVFSFIAIAIISFFQFLLKSKGYIEPKFTEKLSLQKRSKYIYYTHCFSIGVLIGTNLITLFFTFWFNDVFMKMINSSLIGISNYLLSLGVICVYSVSICLSLYLIVMLLSDTALFSLLFKQKITNSYIDDFPHITVKTNGEEISGKVDDMYNKSFLILNKGSVVKAIRWDQIITMEIERTVVKDEITAELLPEITQSKPWWHF